MQYAGLARELGVTMGINLEIDVGLTRGGFPTPEAVGEALQAIAREPRLRLTGLMGYEPHLTGLEADLGHPAVQQVLSIYRGHIERVNAAGIDAEKLTLNGAGSHTLKIYERDKTMNDLAAGSGVVMPTDFDTHHLSHHAPAMFIATPILKHYPNNPVMPEPPPNMAQLYYIYGGKWKAKIDIPGPRTSGRRRSTRARIRARSQTSAARSALEVGRLHVSAGPPRAKSVMLQFGDLVAVRNGEIAAQWPVFHETG